jgi:hypothetical protein
MTPDAPAAKGRRRRGAPLARLRTGEAISLVAAILLFILMFFDWYGVGLTQSPNTLQLISPFVQGGDAWQTLEVIPLFLMLAIAVTVGAALLRLRGSHWKPAIPPAAAICVLGILASVLILIRIISPPDLSAEIEGFVYEPTLKLPIFLALAAALGIAYGGWRTMADEGTSFAAIGKKLESPRRPKSATGEKSRRRKASPRAKS